MLVQGHYAHNGEVLIHPEPFVKQIWRKPHKIRINGANELIEGNSSEDKKSWRPEKSSGFTDSPVNNALVIFFKILLL